MTFTTYHTHCHTIQKHQNHDHPCVWENFKTETSDTITGATKPMDCCGIGALSSFSFQNDQPAIDHPMKSCDESMLSNGDVIDQVKRDDTSTPSLRTVDEEDDDDALSECMASLAFDETDEMFQGFEQYVQQHHYHACNPNTSCPGALIVTDTSRNTANAPMLPTATPKVEWSPKTWLNGRSTATSVGGIYCNNGFEPDFYTLEELRKELFARCEWKLLPAGSGYWVGVSDLLSM